MIRNNNYNKQLFLFGRIFAIIGSFIFAGGLVCFGVSFFVNNEESILALRIMSLTFTLLGVIFSTIGIVAFILAAKSQKKIARLTSGGLFYQGKITRVYANPYQSMNFRHPYIVECVYTDQNGRNCIVKSGNIWLDHGFKNDEIRAKVWVNRNEPRDYFVEVCLASEQHESELIFDVDYR